MKRWIACAGGLPLVLLGTSVAAFASDTESSTAYAVLYQALETAQEIAHYDRLHAIERVESKLAGVAVRDIRIAIHARQGVITVPVGTDGRVEFPITDALKAENPPVVTNQPKGSLTITVAFELRLPEGLRVPYRDIAAALAQARAVVATRAQAGPAPNVAGVEFQFSQPGEASVTVAGKTERLLMADASGHVMLMDDAELERDNPTVVLSTRPAAVLPFIRY